jgi:hypothetical protein
MADDPLAPLLTLPGVAEAGEAVRDALGKAHRHRANLRGWQANAAEAAIRAARASSILDGGGPRFPADGLISGPVLAGALRVAEALQGGATTLVEVWQRAPLQALARLHTLAAADLVDEDRLGRPRDDEDAARRLELLAELVTSGSAAPAPVLASVAHGEILTLRPFGSADGVVARGVSRLITEASGLDPHGLGVPELYWMRHGAEYRTAAAAFASGTPEGVGDWLLMCCRALEAGAREALSIANRS